MHYGKECIIILYSISVNSPHLTHIWNTDIIQEVLYTILFCILVFLIGLTIFIKKENLQLLKNLGAQFTHNVA